MMRTKHDRGLPRRIDTTVRRKLVSLLRSILVMILAVSMAFSAIPSLALAEAVEAIGESIETAVPEGDMVETDDEEGHVTEEDPEEGTGCGDDELQQYEETNPSDIEKAIENEDEIMWSQESTPSVQSESVVALIAESSDFLPGYGTASHPYLISDAGQLDRVRENLTASYMLVNDIDLSGVDSWNPIGDGNNQFMGTFYGAGHKIVNMKVEGHNLHYAGLFGACNNAVIDGVTLENASVHNDTSGIDFTDTPFDDKTLYSGEAIFVGGIVGTNSGDEARIENCYVSGSVSATNCNDAFIGGIIGYGKGIVACTNDADVNVVANRDSRYENDGEVHCGGIVGETTAINTAIWSCINNGRIEASSGYVVSCGGICGSYGSIWGCKNTGSVAGVTTHSPWGSGSYKTHCNVGGIVGDTSSQSTCYSVNYGSVSGHANFGGGCVAGGIAGWLGYYGDGWITGCANYAPSVEAIYQEKVDNQWKDVYGSDVGRIVGRIAWSKGIDGCKSLDTCLINGQYMTSDCTHDAKNGTSLPRANLDESTSNILSIRNLRDANITWNGKPLSELNLNFDDEGVDVNGSYAWLNPDMFSITMQDENGVVEIGLNDSDINYRLSPIGVNDEWILRVYGPSSGRLSSYSSDCVYGFVSARITLRQPKQSIDNAIVLIDGDEPGLHPIAPQKISDYPIVPTVSVSIVNDSQETALVEGRDYVMSIRDNDRPGTAKIKIEGIGDYVGEKTVAFIITDSFLIGRDTNTFAHANKEYLSSGIKVLNPGFLNADGYALTPGHFADLVLGASIGEKCSIMKHASGDWNGACTGITKSMALAYRGIVAVQSMCTSDVSSYSDLPAPCKDTNLLSYINYLHLAQLIKSSGQEYVSTSFNVSERGVASALLNFEALNLGNLEDTLKTIALNQNMMTLSFCAEGGHGHEIILTGKVQDGGDCYLVQCYDLNDFGWNDSLPSFSTMTVYKDFKRFKLDKEKVNESNYLYLKVGDPTRMRYPFSRLDWLSENALSAMSVDTLATQSSVEEATLSIRYDTPCSIDAGGQTLVWDGSQLSGTMELTGFDIVGEGDGMEIVVGIPSCRTVSISGNEAPVSLSLFDNCNYTALESDSLESAKIELGRGAKVDGKGTFDVCCSVGEDELASFEGSTEGELRLSVVDDAAAIQCDAAIDNLVTTTYEDLEKNKVERGSVSMGSTLAIDEDNNLIDPSSIIVHAILYPDGELVIQRGNEIDTSKGEPSEVWEVDEDYAYGRGAKAPWYKHSDRYGNELAPQVTSVAIKDRIAPVSMYSWFSGPTIKEVNGLENIDSSRGTNMSNLFYNSTIEHLDLSSLDTSGATDMSFMFFCFRGSTIDISSFDTSNVTNMSYMFSCCCALPSVDLSALDTSRVEDMSYMFDMSQMEGVCGGRDWKFNSLDVSGFDTSSLKDMSRMFWSCPFKSLAIPWHSMPKLEVAYDAFLNCKDLADIDLSTWDAPSISSIGGFFSRCSSLTSVKLPKLDSGSLTWLREAFNGCSSLEEIDLSGMDTSNVLNMYGMFRNCKKLRRVDLAGFNTSSLKDPAYYGECGSRELFDGCSSLEEVVVGEKFNVSMQGALPDSSVEDNKWWSVAERKWIPAEEIRQSRIGIPDTYRTSAIVDISGATIAAISDQAYTGAALTPRPTVTLGGENLAEGADYRLSYADNVDPGTATVTITGTGGYVGSKSAAFRVVAKSRWVRQGGSWRYYGADGGMARGWKSVGGKWYYLDPSTGAMRTGWLKSGSAWYYLAPSGAMATGWCKVGSSWYYFNASGAMVTGWQKVGNTWYYLKDSGAMATGWLKLGGSWYYFNGSGAMVTGWLRLGSTWYYFASSGAMATGWLKLGGTWYYFNSSGAMLTDRQSIGGRWYTFSSGGAWVA